jgi:hypothetical protein
MCENSLLKDSAQWRWLGMTHNTCVSTMLMNAVVYHINILQIVSISPTVLTSLNELK